MTHFPHFIRDDSGAVTVDWTVLAAAVVGLGVASVGAVRTGVVSLGGDVEASLTGAAVATLNFGASLWAFAPLYVNSIEQLHAPGGLIEQISGWNWTPDQYRDLYDQYAAAVQHWIDQGNSAWAGLYVDHMYSAEQVLLAQGETLHDNAVSLESLHDAVSAM